MIDINYMTAQQYSGHGAIANIISHCYAVTKCKSLSITYLPHCVNCYGKVSGSNSTGKNQDPTRY